MQTRYDKEKSLYEVFIPSLHELDNIKPGTVTNEVKTRCTTYEYHWTGSGSEQENNDIIHRGWSDGLTKLRQALSVTQLPRLKNIRRRRHQTDFGDHLDVQKVYAGQLDTAWTTTRRDVSPSQTGQRLTIACGVDAAARISTDQIFWRGAVTAAIVDMLQLSGRAVRVLAYFGGLESYIGGPRNAEWTIQVKDYVEPMNVETLLAVTGFAGFLRGKGFALMNALPWDTSQGYGYPVYKPTRMARESGDDLLVIENIFSQIAAQELLNNVASKYIGAQS